MAVAPFSPFAVKMPMWPVHTWLPDAHVEAPTAGSVILAAILLKMGGYGFLRFSLPMFPIASHDFAPLIFALSVIAIIYTSLVALVQEDMKKLIAYSSVAHMGFVTIGIFVMNMQGVQGSIFQMLSHGIVSAALFLCVAGLPAAPREIALYGGCPRMPRYAAVLMVSRWRRRRPAPRVRRESSSSPALSGRHLAPRSRAPVSSAPPNSSDLPAGDLRHHHARTAARHPRPRGPRDGYSPAGRGGVLDGLLVRAVLAIFASSSEQCCALPLRAQPPETRRRASPPRRA